MRIRSNLVFISLLAVFISSALVFAQEPMGSIGPKINAEYFALINTQGNPLNVRQKPSALSPVVARLPNGSKVIQL